MVPSVTGTGHSFKGAMAYYLHDKVQDGDRAHPTTADRVAWTEVRNMVDVGPHTATRIMIATAHQADALKAAAGVKNTGRKSNAHVYAYSLAWHPDEAAKLDRAEMIRAADQSLKVLGAEAHQAVIVCHVDQKHPHVHVIVNRVHPETGKMLSTSNDRLKLSDWANQYERERGQILTPRREEKRIAREQFDAASRQDYWAEKKQARQDASTAPQKPVERVGAVFDPSALKQLSDAQKARHKAEWPALSESNQKAREAVYSDFSARIKAASAAHKEAMRPHWGELFRNQQREARAFEREEKTVSGVIRHAMAAALHQQATGAGGQRGLLSLTFANVLSSHARALALAETHQGQRQDLHRQTKKILDGEIQSLKQQRGVALQAQREAFAAERTALIERQNGERAKMREAWRQVYERRGSQIERKEPPPRDQWRQQRQGVKAHRSQIEPVHRRDVRLSDEQQAKGIERKGRNMDQKQRDELMRKYQTAFDRSRVEQLAKAKPHPTDKRFVSTPAPAPSPAGSPATPARKIQDVPQKPDPVKAVQVQRLPRKDWTVAAKPKPATPPKTLQAAREVWEKTAAKAAPKPETPARPETAARKDWSVAAATRATSSAETPRKDWDAAASDKPREIKPLIVRPPSKDRDRER